jgi:hypothetical protein
MCPIKKNDFGYIIPFLKRQYIKYESKCPFCKLSEICDYYHPPTQTKRHTRTCTQTHNHRNGDEKP